MISLVKVAVHSARSLEGVESRVVEVASEEVLGERLRSWEVLFYTYKSAQLRGKSCWQGLVAP